MLVSVPLIYLSGNMNNQKMIYKHRNKLISKFKFYDCNIELVELETYECKFTNIKDILRYVAFIKKDIFNKIKTNELNLDQERLMNECVRIIFVINKSIPDIEMICKRLVKAGVSVILSYTNTVVSYSGKDLNENYEFINQ